MPVFDIPADRDAGADPVVILAKEVLVVWTVRVRAGRIFLGSGTTEDSGAVFPSFVPGGRHEA